MTSTKSKKYKINTVSLIDNNFFAKHDPSQLIKKDINNLPWTEKYRPMTMTDILSHEHIVKSLKNLIASESCPHLLFYGPAGTGKTSLINACAKDLYKEHFPYMVMELNASDDRGVDVVRDKIKFFVNSKNFFYNGPKLVILDEIDAMTIDAQKILRQVIEKYSANARFCLICNYVSKIMYALQSRCAKFRFSPLTSEHIYAGLESIKKNEHINITNDGLMAIVKLSYGDMRKAVNILQSVYMIKDSITVQDVYKINNSLCTEQLEEIMEWIKNDEYSVCYYKIIELLRINGINLNNLILFMTDYIINLNIDIEQKKLLCIQIANIEHNNVSTSNDKIQLASLIGCLKLASLNNL